MEDLDALSKRWLQAERAAYAAEAHAHVDTVGSGVRWGLNVRVVPEMYELSAAEAEREVAESVAKACGEPRNILRGNWSSTTHSATAPIASSCQPSPSTSRS